MIKVQVFKDSRYIYRGKAESTSEEDLLRLLEGVLRSITPTGTKYRLDLTKEES